MMDNFNHDFEQEKRYHPENFDTAIDERGDDSGKDEAILDDDMPDHDCHADTGDDGCDHPSHVPDIE